MGIRNRKSRANTHIFIINETEHFLQRAETVLNAVLVARGGVPQPVVEAVLFLLPCEYVCCWPMWNPHTKQQPRFLTQVHEETAE